MSDIKPELVERMVDLVRGMAKDVAVFPSLSSMDHYAEARNIVERLPDITDPDLIEAREMLLQEPSIHADGIRWHADDFEFVSGLMCAAIKRGRTLATPATSA